MISDDPEDVFLSFETVRNDFRGVGVSLNPNSHLGNQPEKTYLICDNSSTTLVDTSKNRVKF